jgi:hypothetical protein
MLNLVSATDCEEGQNSISITHDSDKQSYTITGSFDATLLGDATSMTDVLNNGVATTKIKAECENLLGKDAVVGWSEGVFTTVYFTKTKWLLFTSNNMLSCAKITATCQKL